MTNKEAIKIIQNAEMSEEFYKEVQSVVEALDLAIKALEFIDDNYPKTFKENIFCNLLCILFRIWKSWN